MILRIMAFSIMNNIQHPNIQYNNKLSTRLSIMV